MKASPMEPKNLVLETRDGWWEVTIRRPEALNALNAETLAELESLVHEFRRRKDLRGILLSGDGAKAFVAGADIRELAELSPIDARALSRRGQGLFRSIEELDRPVIAAVNGFALGGGCELALACHLRVFARTAKIGLPEVGLGVIPGFGGTQRLARLVGLGRALELILTGDPISADEAYRLGIANSVCEPDELMSTCRRLAQKIASRSPKAVSLALRAAVRGSEAPLEAGLELEAAHFGLAAATEDWKEGTSAFLEKRKPEFRGQ